MLNRLNYRVTFPSTGQTFGADISLHEGFWAITGPNEAGKSMIFEMVRYLLFGVDALRGPADDYKTLSASGEFVIRGHKVEIDRTIKTATMKRDGETVATGTKPVNQKVVEELGFGMAVFDIANSINQGEVEQLGKMRPTQRKAMIDSVLGLGALDNVSKWAADEARMLDKQAEAIRDRLAPPGVAPARPDGYVPSGSIDLETARSNSEQLAAVTGWLSVERTAPKPPTCKVDLPSENLRGLAEKRRVVRERVAQLEAQVRGLPEKATYTEDQIQEALWQQQAYDEWCAAQRWLKDHPKPPHTVEELQAIKEQLRQYERYENYLLELRRLQGEIERAENEGTIPCIHCGEETPVEGQHLAHLRDELEKLIVNSPVAIEKPDLSEMNATHWLDQWKQYDEQKAREMERVPEAPAPSIDVNRIMQWRTELLQAALRQDRQAELDVTKRQLDGMADYETMLIEREAYEAALESYKAESLDYQQWLKNREDRLRRKAELAGSSERYAELRAIHEIAVAYERELQFHESRLDAYQTGLEAVEAIEQDAADHRKVRDTMNVLRNLIKQHVLPGLNKVSSLLLRQMTGGQRNLIYIDEEFNVTVDKQNLDTLSGSGKACANLAIRIALGQVLTNGVISILLADEIDASMDAFRGENTSNVLRMLEENISQVLLVSHKAVEADNHIRLGESND